MINTPLVSILMNSHNGGKYLYDSVSSVINQTYQNWELIFFDNFSNDNSYDLIKDFNDHRIKYFRSNKFLTLGEARKAAELHLKGDLIGILDSDDIWLRDKLTNQIKYFDDIRVGLIFSASIYFNNYKEIKVFPYTKFIKKNFYFNLLNKYQIPLETVLLRKKYLDELDYKFDSNFSFISDYDLLIRLSKVCFTVFIPEVTAKWRYHSESDTNKFPLNFVNEKEIWIKNKLNSSSLNNKEIILLKRLESNNNSEKSRLLLVYNSRYEAFSNLIRKTNINMFWVITLILIIFPFSKTILRIRYKRGF